MRYLMVGMGAIGTYIGGSLSLSGEEVIFVERQAGEAGAASHHYQVEIAGQVHPFQPLMVAGAIDEALQRSQVDLVVVAVKSFDTAAVASQLQPQLERFKAVLSLQNGVENELVLAERLGKERILTGTVTSAVGRRGLGKVVLERKRGIGLANDHPLAAQVADSFNRAGLNAGLFWDGSAMKWSKLLTNLLANASSAILDYTPAQIFSDARLFDLEARQLREALAVMDALKYRVVDLPGTPVRMLALLMRSLPLRLSQLIARRALAAGRGSKMPSLHIDLHQGRGSVEVDYLNGAVARFGARAGIIAPVNRFLNDTLLKLSRGEISIDAYRHQPQRLLAELSSMRSQ